MRRSQTAALLLLLVGAVGLLLVAGRTWGYVEVPPELRRGSARIAVPGGALSRGLPALGLGALAGVAALLAARGRARTAVGVVLVLVGAGALVDVAAGLAERSILAGSLDEVAALGDSALDFPVVTLSPWPFLALGAAAAVVAGGVLAVLRGRSWSSLSARYEPATAPASPIGAGTGTGAGTRDPDPDPDAATWAAQDRGEDPTV